MEKRRSDKPKRAATIASRSVQRERLLARLGNNAPRLVFIGGATGLGKTVLAAQVLSLERFDSGAWVDVEESHASTVYLYRSIAVALAGGRCEQWEENPRGLSVADFQEAVSRFLGSLSDSFCLVLDDLGEPEDEGFLHDFCNFVDSSLSPECPELCIVVTSRRTLSPEHLPQCSMWTIGPNQLRFDDDESARCLALLGNSGMDEHAVVRLQQLSGGQAALFSVLARHISDDEQSMEFIASEDVHACLRHIITSQLSPDHQNAMYAAAILGMGTMGELAAVVGSEGAKAFRLQAQALPLVEFGEGPGTQTGHFWVHEIAQTLLLSESFERYLGPCCHELRQRAMSTLVYARRFGRLFEQLLTRADADEMVRWLERSGAELLADCSTRLLELCLAALPTALVLSRPRLLLLQAGLLKLTGGMRDARRKAQVGLELAENMRDQRAEHDALLLLAAIDFDLCRFTDVRERALRLLEASTHLAPEDHAWLCDRLVSSSICLGEFERATSEADELIRLCEGGHNPSAKALALKSRAVISGLARGDWAAAIPLHSAIARVDGVGLHDELTALGNLSTALCETGRLHRAGELLAQVLARAEARGLAYLSYGFAGTMAGVLAGRGEYDLAAETMDRCIRGSERLGCLFDVILNLSYFSTIKRSRHDLEASLTDAERALELANEARFRPGAWIASAEMAATLLGLGDASVAVERATRIVQAARGAGNEYIRLRGALVLAESSRLVGRIDDAVAEIAESRAHLIGESSNWQLAMYIRAFPGLLGVVAKAVGPEHIPAHLLRMLLPENVQAALPMARDVLGEDEWLALAERLIGPTAAKRMLDREKGVPTCRVRMFGGLEVVTEDGVVPERAWRKRKARLLFAMLAVRRGKDVPREQLFEYLWPDMSEERARNNLYVVWNAMKSAIAPKDGQAAQASAYVENLGGVCRINSRLVRSDLDDFEDTLMRARQFESGEETDDALREYERLVDIYRGDLLPGDVYDDWFAPLRERYRQEFGDAMIRAAGLLESAEDHTRALRTIRAALAFDPWREDLYQTALRLQIATGQRSAAIETYMACRARLAEDLGLDPSVETRRLYEEVLAMEEP